MPHKSNQKGFAAIEAVLMIVIVALVAGVGYYVWHANKQTNATYNAALKVAQSSPSKILKNTKTAPDSSISPASNQSTKKGTITGDLAYPAGGGLPDQTVCAVAISGGAPLCFDKPLVGGSDALAYKIEVPTGDYYVYARLDNDQPGGTSISSKTSYKAYYDQYVICGESASCSSAGHSQYVKVTVTANQTATGINPTDWYND